MFLNSFISCQISDSQLSKNVITQDQLYKRAPKRIGLFDSGVGGLSVLRHLVSVTQSEALEFVYLGDTARCPYGNRAQGEIALFVEEIVSWLTSFQLDSIVMACNTSAAIAKGAAVKAAARVAGVTVFDLIEPTADWLIANPPESLGVMATINTAKSKAFSRALTARGYAGKVVEIGCPKLVPLIESGRLGQASCEAELEAALIEYLSALTGVDGLVLGCTHFPFVADRIEKLVSGKLKALYPLGLKLVDPSHALALQLLGLDAPPVVATAPNDYQTSAFKIYTTGSAVDFALAAASCLGQDLGVVSQLDVAELVAAPRELSKKVARSSTASLIPQSVSIDVTTSPSFA